jgi:hypothetical protein
MTHSELCEKLRVEKIRWIVDDYLAVILQIGIVYTEYLSDVENWIMQKDETRTEALNGFKVMSGIRE